MAEQTATATVEEIKNCASCNKPLKKAKRHYRNGKYYCNRNCAKGKNKPAKTEG